MVSQRLRQLRLARGLSLEALAARMGGIVTKQALSKYEQGKANPSPLVLSKLASALEVKTAYLFSEPEIGVRFVAYRKGSGLLKGDQEQVESLVRETLESRVRLQELTQVGNGSELPVRAFHVAGSEDAERAAEELREHWQLGLDPIASLVDVLEDHRVHVLKVAASAKFDGISAVAVKDEQVVAAAVVSREGVPGERERLNLAHEVGHLALDISPQVDEEKAAFRFGAAFLAPAETIRREVGARRAFVQSAELLLLKRRFGMSVQALLYRLRDLSIISESHYVQWCKDVNRVGWRREEPLELPPEEPQWLRRQVLRALGECLISREEAVRLLGEDVAGEEPLSLVERRAFLKLPLAERRRILAEQAEAAAAHYEQDTEWRGLPGGDVVDY